MAKRSYTKGAYRPAHLGYNNQPLSIHNTGFKLGKLRCMPKTIGGIQADYLTKHKKPITLPHVSILDKPEDK